MCRWGCNSTNTTFMCKWCGTWFCKECLRGAYWGEMYEPLKCRVCFQKNCQGPRVDYVERSPVFEGDNKGRKSIGDLNAESGSPSKGSKNSKTKGASGKAKKKNAGKKKKKKT